VSWVEHRRAEVTSVNNSGIKARQEGNWQPESNGSAPGLEVLIGAAHQ
jgi:hypothetical protein